MHKASEIDRRNTISVLYCAGHDTSSILKLTKYVKRTVYRIVAKLIKGESFERKTHSPKSGKKTNSLLLKWIKKKHWYKPYLIHGKIYKVTKFEQNDDLKCN